MRDYVKTLDPKRIVLLDFCLNAPDRGGDDSVLWNWDVKGRIPYMFGPFRAEPQNVIYEDYGQLLGFWLADPENRHNNDPTIWQGFGLDVFRDVPAVLRTLAAMRPCVPRTEENWRKTLSRLAEASDAAFGGWTSHL